jgi:hypothetical protein
MIVATTLTVMAMIATAQAQSDSVQTRELVDRALSFAGLEVQDLSGPIDSVITVESVVAHDYPVPFLGKTLEGETITRITIDSLDLRRRKHPLTDEEREQLVRMTIDMNPESGELLSIRCQRYVIRKELAKEPPVEQAEHDLRLETYHSFVSERVRCSFLEVLEKINFARPFESSEIDAILIDFSSTFYKEARPVWIVITRGGTTLGEATGSHPNPTEPDHVRVTVDARKCRVMSFDNAPWVIN